MKNYIILILCALYTISSTGQSLNIEQNEIQGPNYTKVHVGRGIGSFRITSTSNSYYPRLDFYEGNDNYYGFLRGDKSNNQKVLQLGSAQGIQFWTYDYQWSSKISINSNGFLGINQNNPTAHLEVNGFTKLGSDAPAIKTKLITHTSSAAQGVQTTVLHGLDASKIIGIQALVKQNISDFIPPSNESTAQVAYDTKIAGSEIVIFNRAGNSSNILNKPITILITYIE